VNISKQNTKPITTEAYDALVQDLTAIWATGKAKAQRAVAKQLLETYWRIGGRIAQEQLTENAGYAKSVMGRLANDMRTDMTTLYRCVQFHETYKTVPETEGLAWAHFRVLMTVKDPKEREYYTVQAEKNDWTRDQLLRAVQGDRYGEGQEGEKGEATPPPSRSHIRFQGDSVGCR
jgi:hypothetical protein